MNMKDAFVAVCWVAAVVIALAVLFDVVDEVDQIAAIALAVSVGFIGSIANKFVAP